MYRTLDLRISKAAYDGFFALQCAWRLGHPGDVLRALEARGIRPVPGSFARSDHGKRIRATVSLRMAEDIATLARTEEVSIEAYVGAWLIAGAEWTRETACRTSGTDPKARTVPIGTTNTSSGRKASTSGTTSAPAKCPHGADA